MNGFPQNYNVSRDVTTPYLGIICRPYAENCYTIHMCTKFEVYMRTMKTRKAAQNVDIGVVWGRLLVHPRSSQYNHSLKRMTNSYYYENQIMLARVTAKNAGMFFFLRHSVEKKHWLQRLVSPMLYDVAMTTVHWAVTPSLQYNYKP